MVHRNALLTPTCRRILVERVLSGRPIAHVANETGISSTCAHLDQPVSGPRLGRPSRPRLQTKVLPARHPCESRC